MSGNTFPPTMGQRMALLLEQVTAHGATGVQIAELEDQIGIALRSGVPFNEIEAMVHARSAQGDREMQQAEADRLAERTQLKDGDVEPSMGGTAAQSEGDANAEGITASAKKRLKRKVRKQKRKERLRQAKAQEASVLPQSTIAAQHTTNGDTAMPDPPASASRDDIAEPAAEPSADEELVYNGCRLCHNVWHRLMADMWLKLWGPQFEGTIIRGMPPHKTTLKLEDILSGFVPTCPVCGHRFRKETLKREWDNWQSNTEKLNTLPSFECGKDVRGHAWMRKWEDFVIGGWGLSSQYTEDVALRGSVMLNPALTAAENGSQQAQSFGVRNSLPNAIDSKESGVASSRSGKQVKRSESEHTAPGAIEGTVYDFFDPGSMNIDLGPSTQEPGGLGAAESAVNRGQYFHSTTLDRRAAVRAIESLGHDTVAYPPLPYSGNQTWTQPPAKGPDRTNYPRLRTRNDQLKDEADILKAQLLLAKILKDSNAAGCSTH